MVCILTDHDYFPKHKTQMSLNMTYIIVAKLSFAINSEVKIENLRWSCVDLVDVFLLLLAFHTQGGNGKRWKAWASKT